MTLCIAASCYRPGTTPAIILCADDQLETAYVGGAVGFKFEWAANSWPALFAGDVSCALQLIQVCRRTTRGLELDKDNMIEVFRHAAAVQKRALTDEFVRSRLSVSYQDLLDSDGRGIPEEDRRQLFYDISKLDLGCELIITGFLRPKRGAPEPVILHMTSAGEVRQAFGFQCIGTGAVIADTVLFRRGQKPMYAINETLYCVYEAKRLAEAAPGVGGGTSLVYMLANDKDDDPHDYRLLKGPGVETLEILFTEFGPKPVQLQPEFDIPSTDLREWREQVLSKDEESDD